MKKMLTISMLMILSISVFSHNSEKDAKIAKAYEVVVPNAEEITMMSLGESGSELLMAGVYNNNTIFISLPENNLVTFEAVYKENDLKHLIPIAKDSIILFQRDSMSLLSKDGIKKIADIISGDTVIFYCEKSNQPIYNSKKKTIMSRISYYKGDYEKGPRTNIPIYAEVDLSGKIEIKNFTYSEEFNTDNFWYYFAAPLCTYDENGDYHVGYTISPKISSLNKNGKAETQNVAHAKFKPVTDINMEYRNMNYMGIIYNESFLYSSLQYDKTNKIFYRFYSFPAEVDNNSAEIPNNTREWGYQIFDKKFKNIGDYNIKSKNLLAASILPHEGVLYCITSSNKNTVRIDSITSR